MMISNLRAILPGRGDTFGTVLDRNKGMGPGFDLLRIGLAAFIFLVHTKPLSNPGKAADLIVPVHVPSAAHSMIGAAAQHATTMWDGWMRPILVGLLPMFFALSGFLVTGSAIRLRRVSTFLTFRVLRILPALLTEVTLSALLLGPIFTALPLKAYFSDPGFWRYFGNIVGWITFVLPGVFITGHSTPVINGNLWTLPAEFDCYAVTAVLMAVGLMYKRAFFTAGLIAATLLLAPLNLFTTFGVTEKMVPEYALVFYFMMGVAMFHWREHISTSPALFVGSALVAFLLLESRHTVFLAPLFVTYCTIWFGMLAIPKLPLIRRGDYSYGVYLYGFPICQATIALFPGMVGHRWQLFIVAGVLTCAFAAFSWHVIEKPTLKLKNKLPSWLFPPKAHMPVTQEPAVASA